MVETSNSSEPLGPNDPWVLMGRKASTVKVYLFFRGEVVETRVGYDWTQKRRVTDPTDVPRVHGCSPRLPCRITHGLRPLGVLDHSHVPPVSRTLVACLLTSSQPPLAPLCSPAGPDWSFRCTKSSRKITGTHGSSKEEDPKGTDPGLSTGTNKFIYIVQECDTTKVPRPRWHL